MCLNEQLLNYLHVLGASGKYYHVRTYTKQGPEIIRIFCVQLSIKFILLINVKMPNNWHFNIYEQDNFIQHLRVREQEKLLISYNFF